MWFGEVHLAHIIITSVFALVSRRERNIGCTLALVIWWLLHDQHNEPNQINAVAIYQSMIVFLSLLCVIWLTQGKHWLTHTLIGIGLLVCFLTLAYSGAYYKDLSGALFFTGSMACLISSLRRASL